jgi:hypothetical protein
MPQNLHAFSNFALYIACCVFRTINYCVPNITDILASWCFHLPLFSVSSLPYSPLWFFFAKVCEAEHLA